MSAKKLSAVKLAEIQWADQATREKLAKEHGAQPTIGALAHRGELLSHIAALEAEIAERDALIREMAHNDGRSIYVEDLCAFCGNEPNYHDSDCPITKARDKGILTP